MVTSKVFVGISQLVQPWTTQGASQAPLDICQDAALWLQHGKVAFAGPRVNLPQQARDHEQIDLGGRAVVPGFVDSHTHIVFAGERMDEMARRCRGETYEQIAQTGGGIAFSAAQLAEASEEELVAKARVRLSKMLRRGTTTCEIKTGYGLVLEQEQKHLAAIVALRRESAVDIVATLLLHVVPPSHRHQREAYVQAFCDELLPHAVQSGAVQFCDVFVEPTAFSNDEARAVAQKAQALGIGVKLHVDQLHDNGGAALAASVGAVSADHLEYTQESGCKALAEAGVVATILPGCRLFLGKGPWPQARALRNAGCEVAVATDCNPGSSHVHDLALCATLAATQCGLTLEEALWAITQGGAKALKLADRGTLAVGQRADFVVVDHADWRALLYSPGEAPIAQVVIQGAIA